MEQGARLSLADGRLVLFRPATGADLAGVGGMLACSDPNDLRLVRFDTCADSAALAAQLCRPSGRDLTWIGILPDGAVAGFLHLVRERPGASFAIMVRSDLQRLGLGRAMLAHATRLAYRRGWTPLRADALVENGAMIDLARRFGARVDGPDESGVMHFIFNGFA